MRAWFEKQPVWVRYALVAAAVVVVYLVLQGYGYVEPIRLQPGTN